MRAGETRNSLNACYIRDLSLLKRSATYTHTCSFVFVLKMVTDFREEVCSYKWAYVITFTRKYQYIFTLCGRSCNKLP